MRSLPHSLINWPRAPRPGPHAPFESAPTAGPLVPRVRCPLRTPRPPPTSSLPRSVRPLARSNRRPDVTEPNHRHTYERNESLLSTPLFFLPSSSHLLFASSSPLLGCLLYSPFSRLVWSRPVPSRLVSSVLYSSRVSSPGPRGVGPLITAASSLPRVDYLSFYLRLLHRAPLFSLSVRPRPVFLLGGALPRASLRLYPVDPRSSSRTSSSFPRAGFSWSSSSRCTLPSRFSSLTRDSSFADAPYLLPSHFSLHTDNRPPLPPRSSSVFLAGSRGDLPTISASILRARRVLFPRGVGSSCSTDPTRFDTTRS